MNNIIKHSNATVSRLFFQEENNELKIEVFDNGKGFNSNELNLIEGFGLNQIRARIHTMKGNFTIDSKLDMGTVITIEVSIPKK